MNHRIGIVAALVLLALAFTFAPASAHTRSIDHGGTYFGNVVVQPDQRVDGDVTVFGGDAIVEGTVDGDVNVFGGNIQTEPGSVITGKQNDFGGGLTSFVPWMPAIGLTAVAHENLRLMVRLAYSTIVVLAFLIFPVRVRLALDRVEQHPGLSAAVGVIAVMAVVPVGLLLLISLIGWPLIPLEMIAIFAGTLIGQAALGILIGRRLYELLFSHRTPSPLGALLVGLVVISAAEIVPIVGGLVTGLVWLVGLGAAILAFMGQWPFHPTAVTAPAAPANHNRPTIGGPPMTMA